MRIGVHHETAGRLVREGVLDRIARGQYRLANADVTMHHGLAVVAASVPRGVICLVSALRFHDIGTQTSRETWLAIERRGRTPVLAYPRLHVVRFSGKAFTSGIQHHRIEGRRVRIYSIAKTIADCFKYRHKIGLDVALEALVDAWRSRRVKMAELDRYSRICRVHNVMRPYLEALIV
jgi:predicted transcriptional regulator of viral defense system